MAPNHGAFETTYHVEVRVDDVVRIAHEENGALRRKAANKEERAAYDEEVEFEPNFRRRGFRNDFYKKKTTI